MLHNAERRGLRSAKPFDPSEEAPINGLLGASITYRIATGPREGQKVFMLQTLPAEPDGPRREAAESAKPSYLRNPPTQHRGEAPDSER